MHAVPLVSICCLTYNQSLFIRKCLDGFLMQETSFPIEILIHDDASTDGTDIIIKEYADQFPDLIFPLFETENQYSKGRGLSPSVLDIDYNYSRARGKYVAYCEGDDYWTDPKKLQKQVDFLETHPDYSICWHRCKHFHWEESKWEDDSCKEILNDNTDGVNIDITALFSNWYTQPLSMVFRHSSYDLNWYKRYKYYRDEHEMYHLLTVGKGYLLNFFGGVYVIHGSGIASAQSLKMQSVTSCNISEELYNNNKNEDTKQFFIDSLQWAIVQHRDSLPKKIVFSWKRFMLDGRIKPFIKNLLR